MPDMFALGDLERITCQVVSSPSDSARWETLRALWLDRRGGALGRRQPHDFDRSNATTAQPAAAPSMMKRMSSVDVVRPGTANCANSIETENANAAATTAESSKRCKRSAAPKGKKRSRFPATPTKVRSLNGPSLSRFGVSCGHKVRKRISTTAAGKTASADRRETRSKDGRIPTAQAPGRLHSLRFRSTVLRRAGETPDVCRDEGRVLLRAEPSARLSDLWSLSQ
jgi:hypothetical protein